MASIAGTIPENDADPFSLTEFTGERVRTKYIRYGRPYPELFITHTYHYDHTGRLVRIDDDWDEENENDSVYHFKYDGNGMLMEISHQSLTGAFNAARKFVYRTTGKDTHVTEHQCPRPDDCHKSIEYVLDRKWRVMRLQEHHGTCIHMGNRIIYEYIRFKYDRKGRKVELREYDDEGKHRETVTYEYNEHGDLIKEEMTNRGNERTVDTYEYLYDKHGNWILQRGYSAFYKGRDLSSDRNWLFQRVIEYADE